jgi:hypothetical protein
MAPPATKRRKLEQSEDESEGSFANFEELESAGSGSGSDAEEEANGEESDVSIEGPADDDHVSDDEDAEESAMQKNKKSVPAAAAAAAATPASKAHKRPAATLQDGAYTSESFKSNMFKLQVDELLEQVKPKYGKKEAPAENAMRTLKELIEAIPNRDALSVQLPFDFCCIVLTSCRFQMLKRLLSQLASPFPSPALAPRKTQSTSFPTSDRRASMQQAATRSRPRPSQMTALQSISSSLCPSRSSRTKTTSTTDTSTSAHTTLLAWLLVSRRQRSINLSCRSRADTAISCSLLS